MSNQKTKHDFGRFDFISKLGLFGGLSLLFVLISFAYLGIKGIAYGIDFAGGTEMQVKFDEGVTIDQIRASAEKLNLRNVGVQAFETGNEFIINFQTEEGKSDKETNDIQNKAVESLKSAVMTDFAASNPDIRRVDSVGPQVGAELKRNGLLAVFYCLLVILIYIALRFDYKYAPGAVLCLAHDAIITLAIFVFVGKEVNIPILAAILTLIGYSLNDTIVVFDRIREMEGMYKERGTYFVINKAVNDVLGRTIITSGTTLTSALFLYLFAGGTVSDIGFALFIGILFGTYSSIYVAAPMILFVEKLQGKKVVA